VPKTQTKADIGRLAFRVEGKWWNAYWAPYQDSMKDAQQLGSILMALVEGTAAAPIKDSFMATMRMSFARVIYDVTGKHPIWNDPVTAPSHEHSGRA
jgi:hypothetical protein